MTVLSPLISRSQLRIRPLTEPLRKFSYYFWKRLEWNFVNDCFQLGWLHICSESAATLLAFGLSNRVRNRYPVD